MSASCVKAIEEQCKRVSFVCLNVGTSGSNSNSSKQDWCKVDDEQETKVNEATGEGYRYTQQIIHR